MRIAGVKRADGTAFWVDVEGVEVESLQRVRFQVGGESYEGVVFVTPEQFVKVPENVSGVVEDVIPFIDRDSSMPDLPHADMPPLGTTVAIQGGAATVQRVDAVHRRVEAIGPDGRHHDITMEDVEPA